MTLLKRIAAIVFLLSLSTISATAAEPINTLERSGLFGYKPSGIAIRGFDTVAYFTDGKPLEGSDEFTSEGLDQSDTFVIIWSAAAAQSNWVGTEIRAYIR